MGRLALVRVAALTVVAVLLVPSATAAAAPSPKAFAPGCWKGTGQGTIVGLQSPAPGVTINVDKSGFTFTLRATKKKVNGNLDAAGHGTGQVNASGVTATVDLSVSGTLGLSGKPAAVVVNGDVAAKGSVDIAGTSTPLDFSGP